MDDVGSQGGREKGAILYLYDFVFLVAASAGHLPWWSMDSQFSYLLILARDLDDCYIGLRRHKNEAQGPQVPNSNAQLAWRSTGPGLDPDRAVGIVTNSMIMPPL